MCISIFDLDPVLVYTWHMQKYVMFDHTADLGIEIFGRTKKELFLNAAWAVNDILLEINRRETAVEKEKIITIEGDDLADLLVNFLRELLYSFSGEGKVFTHCDILACGNKRISAKLRLGPYDKKRHLIKTELKAVTYHGLSVEKTRSGWKARVIFDV